MRYSVERVAGLDVPSLAVVVPTASRICGCAALRRHRAIALRPFATTAKCTDSIRVSNPPSVIPEIVEPMAVISARHHFETPPTRVDRNWIESEARAQTFAVGREVGTCQFVESLA